MQQFKAMFPKMKAKVNNLNQYLEASSALLSSFTGEISESQHLKYFITQMVSSKLASDFEVSTETKESLNLLDTCLYSYSDKAMRRIYEDSSVRLLFNYFYAHGQDFFKQQKNVQKNLPEYMAKLEHIFKCYN